MAHIVLLGDSIFDNGRYVPGEPEVAEQLRTALPDGWNVSLLAIDGDVIAGVAGQLARLPGDATHLVISAGGNDALGASYLLGTEVANVAEAIAVLGETQRAFAEDYRRMLDHVLERGLPTALCTVYDTPTTAPDQRIIRTVLAVFNDVISRAAFARRLPLIDLRLICSENQDYANPIEPSAKGGAKIAAAIARMATDSANDCSVVIS